MIVNVTYVVAPPVFVATTLTTSTNETVGFTVIYGSKSPLTVTPATLILAVFVQSDPSLAFRAYAFIGQALCELTIFP